MIWDKTRHLASNLYKAQGLSNGVSVPNSYVEESQSFVGLIFSFFPIVFDYVILFWEIHYLHFSLIFVICLYHIKCVYILTFYLFFF